MYQTVENSTFAKYRSFTSSSPYSYLKQKVVVIDLAQFSEASLNVNLPISILSRKIQKIVFTDDGLHFVVFSYVFSSYPFTEEMFSSTRVINLDAVSVYDAEKGHKVAEMKFGWHTEMIMISNKGSIGDFAILATPNFDGENNVLSFDDNNKFNFSDKSYEIGNRNYLH